jgi:hypothetical protein
MKITFFVFLSVIILSCGTSKLSDTGTIEQTEKESNTIAFVVLKLRNDPLHGKNVIELVSIRKSAGVFKNHESQSEGFKNSLTIELFKNGSRIHTQTIQHPLYKTIEYMDENKAFKTKDIELKEAEFFTRLQIRGNGNELRIFEKLQDTPPQKLLTLPL